MVIAVTEKDEINLLACFLASRFDVPKRFARLRNKEFSDQNRIFSPDELSIDQIINPGQIIIKTILQILETPGVVSVAEFADGEILLREFDVPENAPLAGKTIHDIRSITQMDSFLIVAIVRDGELIIPKDQDIIQAGDRFYTLVDKEFLPFLLPMLNRTMDQVEKIIIYGATSTSTQLASILEKNMLDVCIIEPSREKAQRAADQLKRTVVQHGSGTDMDLFNEINMKDADFFLALSHDDESNILSALLAKKYGAKRALVITHDPEYIPILDSIGMDITINPRLITVSAILKHLRKGRVMSVFKLIEDAEVMEIEVEEDSSIANKQIVNIKFPKGAMIGAVLRKGEMLLPDDEVTLEAEDSVIIVALPGTIEKIEKLFGRKRSFLPFR
jgi:trk system potassium uptake protein TrkA